ncbi:uncharacterized protein [Palaemon carinicauda]|uniref:uncharacterized protein n=1 Tax=Palaemon carinicauda TaxID=392227 RepID=UPI0035B59CBC
MKHKSSERLHNFLVEGTKLYPHPTMEGSLTVVPCSYLPDLKHGRANQEKQYDIQNKRNKEAHLQCISVVPDDIKVHATFLARQRLPIPYIIVKEPSALWAKVF